MRVILDTNILIAAIPRGSKYQPIVDRLFIGDYEVFVTTEILLEYEERIASFFNPRTAELFMRAFVNSPFVHKVQVYFNFQIIETDLDDNKFVDCALKGGVKYIVSEDRHLRALNRMEFPFLKVLRIDDFLLELEILKGY